MILFGISHDFPVKSHPCVTSERVDACLEHGLQAIAIIWLGFCTVKEINVITLKFLCFFYFTENNPCFRSDTNQ